MRFHQLIRYLVPMQIILGVNTEAVNRGPYISIPIRQEDCKTVSKPYEAVRSMLVQTELVNGTATTYSKGNITVVVPKKWSNVLVKGRIYRREEDQWHLVKMMNSFGCRGFIGTSILRVMNIKYNQNVCSLLPKGIYKFDKVDLNMLEHLLWPSNREYGQFLWIFDVQTPSATLICYEYESWVVPLKTSRKDAKKDKTDE